MATSEIAVDKTKISASMKTLVAILMAMFAAGGAYMTLRTDIIELKNGYQSLSTKEERREEHEQETALHMQRIDDALDHVKDAVDRIDKNVQELRSNHQ